jgi:hypothetical protein
MHNASQKKKVSAKKSNAAIRKEETERPKQPVASNAVG